MAVANPDYRNNYNYIKLKCDSNNNKIGLIKGLIYYIVVCGYLFIIFPSKVITNLE